MEFDSLERLLEPLAALSQTSHFLSGRPLGPVPCGGAVIELPSYIFIGSPSGGDPVRIGLFAGIHGDEPGGSHALVEFGQWLEKNPEFVRGYELSFYPVCNPSGWVRKSRCSDDGRDLNREFWKDSILQEYQQFLAFAANL